ncbi:MAG: PTS sugar transporter subunit IIB [Lachnospiraceae bacterium]|jgi:PTS system cellobiose-specific IIB component|nr:PTS sugar transporter subunit IIB [Lachnospiraceae bacterium]
MRQILIVCGAGASSGFMAKNIRQELKKRGITGEYSFLARSDAELEEYIDEIDMLLLGPHLKYMYASMKEYCDGYKVPVYVIDQKAYGMLDGGAIVDFVIDKFAENSKN